MHCCLHTITLYSHTQTRFPRPTTMGQTHGYLQERPPPPPPPVVAPAPAVRARAASPASAPPARGKIDLQALQKQNHVSVVLFPNAYENTRKRMRDFCGRPACATLINFEGDLSTVMKQKDARTICSALRRVLTKTDGEAFLRHVVPFMKQQLTLLLQHGPYYLELLSNANAAPDHGGKVRSRGGTPRMRVEIPREGIAKLLIMGFLSLYTVPANDRWMRSPNWSTLFNGGADRDARLRSLLQYFLHEATTFPVAPAPRVEFELWAPPLWKFDARNHRDKDLLDALSASTLPVRPFEFARPDSAIENAPPKYALVDFASARLGGSVLDFGHVQEEILFATHAECCATLVFVPCLADEDAVVMRNIRRFAFGRYNVKEHNAFRFHEPCRGSDQLRTIIAIDAKNFSEFQDPFEQFRRHHVIREAIKAITGFCAVTQPIATGNWGCGVFQGNLFLKGVIQLIAASFSKNEAKYYPFHTNVQLLGQLQDKLVLRKVPVGQLWNALLKACEDVRRNKSLKVRNLGLELSHQIQKHCFGEKADDGFRSPRRVNFGEEKARDVDSADNRNLVGLTFVIAPGILRDFFQVDFLSVLNRQAKRQHVSFAPVPLEDTRAVLVMHRASSEHRMEWPVAEQACGRWLAKHPVMLIICRRNEGTNLLMPKEVPKDFWAKCTDGNIPSVASMQAWGKPWLAVICLDFQSDKASSDKLRWHAANAIRYGDKPSRYEQIIDWLSPLPLKRSPDE